MFVESHVSLRWIYMMLMICPVNAYRMEKIQSVVVLVFSFTVSLTPTLGAGLIITSMNPPRLLHKNLCFSF